MGGEHPRVLVVEASTLHFVLYSRTQHMRHFSHSEIQGYRLGLGAKIEFPTETRKQTLKIFLRFSNYNLQMIFQK